MVEEEDKLLRVFELLNSYDLKNNKAIIFCNRKLTCNNLENFLRTNNMLPGVLHSDKAQVVRSKIIQQFTKGYARILIATDVAARGLDLPNVHLIINFDMPENLDDYLHRIGRTGRAGNTGTAIT